MPRAIGIDLGTTNSLVAHVDERNRPRALPVDEGRPLLPSAVHYGADGAIEVGAAAKRRAPERPLDTVLSVKRFMGRGPGDVRAEDRGIYRFDEGGAVVKLRWRGGARAVTPIEVSAEILRVLKRRAHEALGGPPGALRHHRARLLRRRAAPGDQGRRPARRARRAPPPQRADRGRARLRPRPAQARGRSRSTTSAAAPSTSRSCGSQGDVFEVLSTGGDTHLGGDDFDRIVARQLLAEGLEPRTAAPSPAVLRGAVAAAQRIRETLSSQDAVEADVELPEGIRLRAAARPRRARGAHPPGRRADHRPVPRGARATRGRRRWTASSSSAGRRAPRSSAAT